MTYSIITKRLESLMYKTELKFTSMWHKHSIEQKVWSETDVIKYHTV